MTNPPAGTRTDADAGKRAIEEIACPIERVQAINAIARRDGTLRNGLSQMRTAALREARALTASVTELASKVGMGRSRVSTLLNTAPTTTATGAGR